MEKLKSPDELELLKVRADFKKLSINDINSERGKSLIVKINELDQKIKAIKNSNQIKYKITQSPYTNSVTVMLMPMSDYHKPIFLTNKELVNFTAKTTGLENYATDRFGIATAINGTSCAIYLFRTLIGDAISWHYLFRESVEQSVERCLKENNLEFEPIEI